MPRQLSLDDQFAALDSAEEDLLDACIALDTSIAAHADDGDLAGGFRPKLALTPRIYQTEALDAWLAAAGRGTVVLPTGAGKTQLALMTIARMRLQTLILVPTIELLHQWHSALIERLGLTAAHVGMLGDGKRDRRSVTVATYASASMPDAPIGGCGLLVIDEAHHLPAPAYRPIVARSGAPYCLALTATPERGDGQEDALYALAGPVVYRRTPEDLAAEGHLARFRKKRIAIDLSPDEALRYGALMNEWKWFLARNRAALGSGGDFFGTLIKRSGSDPAARSALRAHHQARMIALNAEAKISTVTDLLARHGADKVLIFSEYNVLVDQVARHLALPAITYRTPPDQRRAALEGFRSGAFSKLVAGRVLNEGVDVPDATVAIVLSGSAAPREHIQRLGRVLRPKQHEAVLYELVTRHTSEVSASRRRNRAVGDS